MMRDATTQLLTTGQLAKMFDVHPSTVRRWELAGVIPAATRRRGRRVYTANDVERIRQAVYVTPPTVMAETV